MISSQHRPFGKEKQDSLTKLPVWEGNSTLPYRIGRLVRKIKISLQNRPSGQENQDVLTESVVW